MKPIITIALLTLGIGLFASVDKTKEHIDAMKADGSLSNVIQTLMSSGEVCALRGHNWTWGRPGEGPTCMFADYHPGISYEHCVMCNAVKTTKQVEAVYPNILVTNLIRLPNGTYVIPN